MEPELKEMLKKSRETIQEIGTTVLTLKAHSDFSKDENYVGQHGEMIANIMLSYRHLEDAKIRLGKVLQAQDGGTSVYDK